jgi:nitrite reductase/ring-hydroxylating ferredoxin subunit
MSTEYVVAKIGDLPEGGHKIVRAGGKELGLFNVRGHYYALPNACIHQNGPLCLGAVSGTVEANHETGWKRSWIREGEVIVCPWHSMEFEIPTGECLSDRRRSLTTYKVDIVDKEIKVIFP